MNDKKTKGLPLDAALKSALNSIDNQVAREMQRDPIETGAYGLEKWEPYQKRVERLTALILGWTGSGETQLDSLLVLSQACVKSLSMYVRELEAEGLGKVRSAYCHEALVALEADLRAAVSELVSDSGLN